MRSTFQHSTNRPSNKINLTLAWKIWVRKIGLGNICLKTHQVKRNLLLTKSVSMNSKDSNKRSKNLCEIIISTITSLSFQIKILRFQNSKPGFLYSKWLYRMMISWKDSKTGNRMCLLFKKVFINTFIMIKK